MILVRYGGLEFSSRPLPEPSPAFPILQGGFQGWFSRAAARSSDVERPGGHGSFDAPVRLSSRLVTMTVHLDPGDERGYRLLAGLPLRDRFTVSEDGESAWADAHLIEVVANVDQLGKHSRADLVFRFPNPRKYGEQHEFVSSGASVAAFHYGNFDADPVFEVSGFVNGYRITGPGGSFTVPGPKASATVDRIDFSTGLFTRNGVPVTRAATQTDTWQVPVATRVSWRVQPIGSGTGSARMLLTDTWI